MKKLKTVRKTVRLRGPKPHRKPNEVKPEVPKILWNGWDVGDVLTKLVFLVFGLFSMLSLKSSPSFTANGLFGGVLPIYGSLQMQLNKPLDRLYASSQHWKTYWTMYLFFLFLDYTLCLPFSLYLPFLYFGVKSVLLFLISLPQTNLLTKLRESLEDNEDLMYILSQNSVLEALPLLQEFSKTFFGYDYLISTVKIMGNNSLDFREKLPEEGHNTWTQRVRLQGFVVCEVMNTEKNYLEELEKVQEFMGDLVLNDLVDFSSPQSRSVFKQFFTLWNNLYDSHFNLLYKLETNLVTEFDERRKQKTARDQIKKFKTKRPFSVEMDAEREDARPEMLNITCVSKLVTVFETCAENIFPLLYFQYCGLYSLLLELYTLEYERFKDKIPQDFKTNLLIKPIQRITKYPLLFKELSKHLTDGRTKARLLRLADSFSSIVLFANSKASEASNMLMMAEVSQRLKVNKEKFLGLLEFEARKVYCSKYAPFNDRPHMGLAYIATTHEKRVGSSLSKRLKPTHTVLFNDLLVLASVKKSWLPPYEKVYPVKKVVKLFGLKLVEPFEIQKDKDTLFAFSVSRSDKMKLTVAFHEENRRDHWLENMRSALEFAHAHPGSADALVLDEKKTGALNDGASVFTETETVLESRKQKQLKYSMRYAAMTIQEATRYRIDTLRR